MSNRSKKIPELTSATSISNTDLLIVEQFGANTSTTKKVTANTFANYIAAQVGAVSGTKGQKGEAGSAGTKGEAGSAGTKGEAGVGTKGEAGTAGTKGEAGTAGTKGEAGTKGDKGDAGTGDSVDNNIWIETFASETPVTDIVQLATSIEYDADGNIIALFNHLIPGESDNRYTSVAKISPMGGLLWQTRFTGNLYTDGWGLAYDPTHDAVYIAGDTSGTPLTYKFATLTKLSSVDGSIDWNKTYDFEADSESAVVDVDSSGNPIMVGHAYNGTDSYIITTKVDRTDGTILWSRSLDGQGDEEAYGMAVGPAGEVVAIGFMSQLGVNNGVATLYADNNLNWTGGGLGGTSNGVAFSVTVTAGVATFSNISDTIGNRSVDDVIATINGSIFGGVDGVDDMVVKVGTLAANNEDDRMVVVKYDTDGTIAWQKAVQFEEGYDCYGADADIDSNGNIYVCGQYQYDTGDGTDSAMGIVKFDSSGVKQWTRRVVGNCETFATSIVVGDDNNLYLSGITGVNATTDFIWCVVKYDTSGALIWQRLIDNTTGWTFGGNFWFAQGGGSNIAVRNGYIALAGGYYDFPDADTASATVLQIDTNATPFSISDWDIKGANFTAVFNASASDIDVVDAGKTSSTVAPAVADFVVGTDNSNFLIGTLYTAPDGNDSLINGAYTVTLNNAGTVTLPAGGTITEGVVTSNPTIQFTPASPDVASQKLVVKGGGSYNANNNGIALNWYVDTASVDDTVQIYVYSPANANGTLYWWVYPEGAGIATPESGTVSIGEGGVGNNAISFVVDSDDYEFTVRVSPEDNNYDPANVGVETTLFNASAPTFEGEHHLHLTTGDLSETSIFLGTDNHNIRTTVDGKIQITTPSETNRVWEFGTDGGTTFPTLTVQRGDNPSGTIQGQTLLFGNANEEAIITTPDGTAGNEYSQRLVINPGKGYDYGEGGDIYLWAGRGGDGSGSGGDIKIRGGKGGANSMGGSGGAGGYIRMEAGDGAVGDGVAGTAGYIQITGGYGLVQGGDVTITGGTGGTTHGKVRLATSGHNWDFGADGKLTLPGGYGQVVVEDDDGVRIGTADLNVAPSSHIKIGGADHAFEIFGGPPGYSWKFDADGRTTFPDTSVPIHSTGATGDKEGMVAFGSEHIYYCTVDYGLTQYSAETRVGDADGVDNGYLIPDSYELPSIGWIIYYNDQTAVINQVNNGGNSGYYTVFTATPLFIPANAAIQYGPPATTDIWKRVAWSEDTW